MARASVVSYEAPVWIASAVPSAEPGRGRCADTGQTHPNQLELAADYETGHWVAHDETDHRTDDDRTVDHVLTADARFQVNQRGGKCHQNTLKHSCSPSLFV